VTGERTGPPARAASAYVDRFLDDVTLPRVVVRAAECLLLSRIEMPRPILDVGCGDGSFADALFDEPVEVGIDPWREPLEQARRLRAYRHLVHADGEALPFPDATFATVFSNSTLEHTRSPWAVLREMHRVARSGGLCLITVPSERFPEYLLGSTLLGKLGLEAAADRYGAFMNAISRHRHVVAADVWQGWLEEAGFTVEGRRYYFSHRNTMLLDVFHYVSAPSLITKKLLGRWVLWPAKKRYLPYTRLLSRFADPGDADDGAYMLFQAVKK